MIFFLTLRRRSCLCCLKRRNPIAVAGLTVRYEECARLGFKRLTENTRRLRRPFVRGSNEAAERTWKMKEAFQFRAPGLYNRTGGSQKRAATDSNLSTIHQPGCVVKVFNFHLDDMPPRACHQALPRWLPCNGLQRADPLQSDAPDLRRCTFYLNILMRLPASETRI